MKCIQAYEVDGQLFKTYEEALARQRGIAMKNLINGMDIYQFMQEFCTSEEFRDEVTHIGRAGAKWDE